MKRLLGLLVSGRSPAARVPGFEPALFALSPGQQLGPQNFGGVWWIALCLDKSPAVTLPFERVRDDCRNAVRLEKGLSSHSRSQP